MQKYTIFLPIITLLLLLPSVYAMKEIETQEKIELLANNFSIDTIATVDDPVKFGILVQGIAEKYNNLEIIGQAVSSEGFPNNDKKFQLLKESTSELNILHRNIAKKIAKFGQQALDPWNAERLKGLGKTFMWGIWAAGLVGTQAWVYFSDLNPDAKMVVGVPLIAGSLASFMQLFKHASKTTGNTHINEKIANHLEKIALLRKAKKNILEDIESLTKGVERQKNEVQSSEFDEIDIH